MFDLAKVISDFYTNASKTPFKARMVSNEAIEPTALSQRCFRPHHDPDSFFYFNMLGTLSNSESLDSIGNDVIRFLTEVESFPKERLHVVLDPEDADLNQWASSHFPPENRHIMKGNNEIYWTRWKYGNTFPLTGRGLTISYESTDKTCADSCGLHCSCGRYFPMGNIIVIKGAEGSQNYVETAFGAEAILAAREAGNFFKISGYQGFVCQVTSQLKGSERLARHAVNYLISSSVLTSEKIYPGKRGQNYIARRMVRELVGALLKEFSLEEVSLKIEILGGILRELKPSVLKPDELELGASVFQTEANQYILSLQKLWPQLLEKKHQFLAQFNEEGLRKHLRETKGLPEALVDGLIKLVLMETLE